MRRSGEEIRLRISRLSEAGRPLHTRRMHRTEDSIREFLRRRLRAAMRARDLLAVTALRSAISALDNAEAVDLSEVAESAPVTTGEHVAGGVVGLGATEVPRRVLDAVQQHAVVVNEISDRRSAADAYEQRGATDPAVRLRAEAAVLERALEAERERA